MVLAALPTLVTRLRPSVTGRRIVSVIMFVLAAALLAWIGWNYGRYRPVYFRVAGPSMAPTLLGEHYVGVCQGCGRQEIALDASSNEKLPTDVPCFLCGSSLAIDSETIYQGHAVLVTPPSPGQAIKIGQLVAIDSREGAPLRVKRVVAVGGQTVGHHFDRLMVDGHRVEDFLHNHDPTALSRMIVADESRLSAGSTNRWKPSDQDRSAWRFVDNQWSRSRAAESDWLVYHHVNVHEGGVAGPVLDDYEYNATLIRRLDDADRLQVTADVAVAGACRIEVAYWTPEGVAIESQNLPPDSESLSWNPLRFSIYQADQDAHATNAVRVTRESPVAIRIAAPRQSAAEESLSVSLRNLRVWKCVTYRMRRNDDRSQYPITLRDDEYFVVGDNGPVSIDSRSHGPISRDKIVGVITPE